MFKNYAVLALLGLVSADQIPLLKRELTQDMLDSQQSLNDGDKIDIVNHNDSEYYVSINIGTPGQPIEVALDTTTSNVWALGTGCTLINGCRGKTVYKSKKSSTFKKNAKKIAIATDVNGIISNDKINIGGVNSQMDFAEIGKPPKGHFADSKVTGVIGLGFPDAIVGGIEKTFMDQVDSDDQSFEIMIAKNPAQSYLTIPAPKKASNGQDTHYVTERKYWALHADYIQNGSEAKILTPKTKVILDTSSSLIHGPKEVMGPLIASITVSEDCSNVDSLPALKFALDGMPYTLWGSDYVQKVDGKCQLGVKATDATDNYIHLGTQFIAKVSPVTFDYGRGYVKFTRPMESADVEFIM